LLGVFNFDGAAVVLRPKPWFSTELYAGGTLVQGLNRPLDSDALSPVEDLPPQDGAYLFGATAQFRSGPRGSLKVQYQREIRRDRGALYSERFGANGELNVGRAIWSGELTRDLATGEFNDLSLAVRRPLPLSTSVRLEARRYVPYFDLWTIWGAFAPVAYTEGRANLDWTSRRLTLGVSGGRRSYDDTETGVAFLPLRTDGWRIGGTGLLRASDTWSVHGSYNMDIGVGASSSDEDVALRWSPSDALTLGVRGLAFQNIYEFQVGSGRVVGGGGEIAWRLFPEVRLVADALLYHHTGKDSPQRVNWNQRRGMLRVEWTLGGANPVRIR
jgi:hypothetical protein